MTSRIASLVAGDHEEGNRYCEYIRHVVGDPVATFLTENGQQPGLQLSASEGISLDRMGEGVSSALALIAELSSPGYRLFLIEEPENDLHPQALRALLDLIVETSDSQFIVSTHSDLVLRHLGSVEGAVVYRSTLTNDEGLPTTSYQRVNDSFDRLAALEELGYEPKLLGGWLIFEESSAEQVVRTALIPAFAPRLAALTTVSASGAGKVTGLVQDLHRTVLFAHLSDKKLPRAWVIVDGDDAGTAACTALREKFQSWPADRFVTLDQPQFEDFYPSRFQAEVEKIRAIGDSRTRSRMKGELAGAVSRWALDEPVTAAKEFEVSAAPVVAVLRRIESQVASLFE